MTTPKRANPAIGERVCAYEAQPFYIEGVVSGLTVNGLTPISTEYGLLRIPVADVKFLPGILTDADVKAFLG
ncbi:MAG: hypothetical protein ABIY38_07900 [Rhodococcus sp. (in: high G+C Gram-positive bacteria)]